MKPYFFITDEPDPLKLEAENKEIHEIVQKKRGDIFVTFCRVNDRGNPKGALQWKRRSNDIAVYSVSQITPTILSLEFIILKRQHNGTYTCNIGNEIGIQKKSFQLIVFGELSSD